MLHIYNHVYAPGAPPMTNLNPKTFSLDTVPHHRLFKRCLILLGAGTDRNHLLIMSGCESGVRGEHP